MKYLASLVLLLACFQSMELAAQNPLIPDVGMSDPHVRVYGDSLYLFCGHDDHPDDRTWVMKEWRVFSSGDLTRWKQVGTISTEDNYMPDSSTDCWAGDGAQRNGKYYFYFSDRKRSIGVMQAEHPAGPYRDALGKPLVAPLHDPTILVDDDPGKTPYLVYGDKSDAYFIARLNEDMISLAETPRRIEIGGEEWERAPEWMDKNYIFKYGDTYYLSWGRDYAVSRNVYGPYVSVGAVGEGHHINEFAHGSFFWWKGQFYHMWCYYIREGYKYRETIMTYCHFDDEGRIVTDTDFLDIHFSTGVGSYEASWPEIQAEWYYACSPGTLKKGTREDGFVVSKLSDGSWLVFSKVEFSKPSRTFEARCSVKGGSGILELRSGSPEGELLGKMSVEAMPGGEEFRSLKCAVEIPPGKKDICVCFRTDEESILSVDWIRFDEASLVK